VFLVCFSVVSPTSYENVKTKWWPEIQRHAPGVPCILVGTKEDLRYNEEVVGRLRAEQKLPLSQQDGVRLAQEIGALKYIECSALTQKGLKSVFDEAIKVRSPPRAARGPPCVCSAQTSACVACAQLEPRPSLHITRPLPTQVALEAKLAATRAAKKKKGCSIM